MMQKNIGIIDYGVGNHSSIVASIKSLGHLVTLSKKIDELEKCDALLLPGVGSFPTAIKGLEYFGLIEFIKKWAQDRKPIIGICLGMQIMATSGTEGGYCNGLDLLPGKVIKISGDKTHTGWNSLRLNYTSNFLNDFKEKNFYFNHSYILQTSADLVIATAKFEDDIPAIVIRDSVVGLQFHPEKSQRYGSILLMKIINGIHK